MSAPITRAQHSRAGLRYGNDVTDAEWLILAPFLPPARACGSPRKWPMREIVNAIFYVLRGGIAWNLLPKDFPPSPTAMPGLPCCTTTAHGRRSTITRSCATGSAAVVRPASGCRDRQPDRQDD